MLLIFSCCLVPFKISSNASNFGLFYKQKIQFFLNQSIFAVFQMPNTSDKRIFQNFISLAPLMLPSRRWNHLKILILIKININNLKFRLCFCLLIYWSTGFQKKWRDWLAVGIKSNQVVYSLSPDANALRLLNPRMLGFETFNCVPLGVDAF